MENNNKMPQIRNKRNELIDRFFVKKLQNNLGYAVFDELAEDGVTLKRREIFYHTSEDVAKVALQDVIKCTFDIRKYAKIEKLQPQIVIFNEKHYSRYFIYQSREEFYKIFLQILEERNAEGWYDFEIGKEPVNETGMSIDEIEKLTDEMLKKFQKNRYQSYLQNLRNWREENKLRIDTETAISKKDGALAYYVILERNSSEYEGFEIVTPETIE